MTTDPGGDSTAAGRPRLNDAQDRIRATRAGAVDVLTLSRPEAKNAFDGVMYDVLAERLSEAAADGSVSCVVILGDGGVFSAGADLADLARAVQGDSSAARSYNQMMRVIEEFPKPLIAGVVGAAVGIGFTILGHMDLVIVAEDARFRAPFALLGLTPEAGSTATFPARLGWQQTARALFTADWLSAGDIVSARFALEAVPAAQVADRALALAQRVAQHPLNSVVATKSLLLAARGDVRAAREREDALFVSALALPETRRRIEDTLRALGGEGRGTDVQRDAGAPANGR